MPLSNPKAWQRHWHAVFDEALGPDGPEPEDMPDDIDTDFRLQFELWDLDAAARERVFSVFPRHGDMLARIQTHQAAPRRAIGPDEATRLLRDGLGLLKGMGIEAPDAATTVEVIDDSKTTLLKAFATAESPFVYLHDQLDEMALQETGGAGKDAYHFLVEPLYRLAASYPVLHWILWPLCATPGAVDPTEASYRLWQGGWSPGWQEDRLFIFDRRKEFGLA